MKLFVFLSVGITCVQTSLTPFHQVNKMSHFTDLSKVEQVSSMVRRMEKEIEECSDQAMLFNSREQ